MARVTINRTTSYLASSPGCLGRGYVLLGLGSLVKRATPVTCISKGGSGRVMAETTSIEAEAFREASGKLVDLVYQPDVLAWKLFSKKLIVKEARDNACMDTVSVVRRTMALMQAIEAQFKSKPDRFHQFLSVLRENEQFLPLYEELNGIYRKCIVI